MSDVVLKIRNLKKKFAHHTVLKSIDLDIYKGEVVGVIGTSGSGKTTLLHSMIGFLQPEVGEVEILVEPTHRALGKPVYKNVYRHMKVAKKVYGFASQMPSFYDNLTVRENLEYFGSLYDLPKKIIKTNAEILLHLMDLSHAQKLLAKNLSGGMERRLDIALALMHDPALLILDEPTADLDPVLRNHIYDLIKRVNAKNTTIILSSHHLSEVEHLCSKIAVLKQGKIHFAGSPQELKKKFSPYVQLHCTTKKGNYHELASQMRKRKTSIKVTSTHEGIKVLTEQPKESVQEVMHILSKLEDDIVQLHVAQPTLDEVFISIMEEKA